MPKNVSLPPLVTMKLASALQLLSAAASTNALTFNDDGVLKIVQFADLHSHSGDVADDAALKFMDSVLESEKVRDRGDLRL